MVSGPMNNTRFGTITLDNEEKSRNQIMTAKEEPSWFNEQLPPEVRELVAKAFEAMDEKGRTFPQSLNECCHFSFLAYWHS